MKSFFSILMMSLAMTLFVSLPVFAEDSDTETSETSPTASGGGNTTAPSTTASDSTGGSSADPKINEPHGPTATTSTSYVGAICKDGSCYRNVQGLSSNCNSDIGSDPCIFSGALNSGSGGSDKTGTVK